MSGIDELDRMRKRKLSKPPEPTSRESLRALDKEQLIDLTLELCSEIIDLKLILGQITELIWEFEEKIR